MSSGTESRSSANLRRTRGIPGTRARPWRPRAAPRVIRSMKTAYSTDAPSSPPRRPHHARHSDSSRSTPRYAHTRRKSCHVARPVSCSSTSANASERWVLASRETLWSSERGAHGGVELEEADSRMPKGASRGAEVGAGIEGRRSGRGRRGRAVLRFSSASSMRSSVMIPRAFFSGMERSLPEGTLAGETRRRSDGTTWTRRRVARRWKPRSCGWCFRAQFGWRSRT